MRNLIAFLSTTFRKFNVDICGKKPLEKIQNLAWDTQKIVISACAYSRSKYFVL